MTKPNPTAEASNTPKSAREVAREWLREEWNKADGPLTGVVNDVRLLCFQERLIALITRERALEREACALIADDRKRAYGLVEKVETGLMALRAQAMGDACSHIATAIRSRTDTAEKESLRESE